MRTSASSSNRILTAVVLCVALARPEVSAAQPGPQGVREQAIAMYERGSEAFAERRFKDAIDQFLAADVLVPSGALAYNITLAYEGMDDSSGALRWAREYLRRSPNADDRRDVEKKVDSLQRKLRDAGVQQVTVISHPEGATVRIDGRTAGATPWTGDIAPGEHELQLDLRGHTLHRQRFTLAPERALDVELALSAQTEVAAPPPRPARVPAAHSPPAGTALPPLAIGGIVALASGVVSGGVALGLEVARAGAESDAAQAPTQLAAVDHLAQMEDLQLGARVAIGLGAGLVVGGGAMIVAGLLTDGQQPVSTSAACSSDGCFASLFGSF